MRNPKDSNFCYYPFFQILLSADGQYKPCSKHRDVITHQGKILNTSNATLQDAWTSDYMEDMREQFNSNKQFPGCSECWRMQKMGLRSMRYDSYQYHITEKQVANPISPVRIELNSSNVCNLKCRICSPNASTKWITEYKKFYNSKQGIHINLNEENLRQVKGWAENLEEICFFGGEPLLFNENIELLHYLIDQRLASRIDLLFNTNGTVFSDEIAIMLSKFKRVRISISIDDIGERFEYQRSNAKWAEVEKNLKVAYGYSMLPIWKNVEFKICQSLSTFNAYYLPEFFDYFNQTFPGLIVYWNLIYHPWEFNIQILPPEVKKAIKTRWQNEVRTTFTLSHDETKTIEDLITYMEYDEQKDFGEFFRTINRHDVYRLENYAIVFPEFWALLKAYLPDDLIMGQYDPSDEWIKRSEQYDVSIDYSAKIKARLEAYLIKRYPAKSVAEHTQRFFDRLESIVKTGQNMKDRNLIFYLMNLSRIKEVYEDITLTDQEQIVPKLKAYIAEYFYNDPNRYYAEVDYENVVTLQINKFLKTMYNDQHSDQLTAVFSEMALQKINHTDDTGSLNSTFFIMMKLPIEQLYNDVISGSSKTLMDKLAQIKVKYSQANPNIYHPEFNYAKIIQTEVKRFLTDTGSSAQAEELITLFTTKTNDKMAIYDGGLENENMVYFIMMRTPINELYQDVMDENHVRLIDRLIQQKSSYYYQNRQPYDPLIDYSKRVYNEMTRYLQIGNTADGSRQITDSFFSRIAKYISDDKKNFIYYLMYYSPVNKVIEDLHKMSDEELQERLNTTIAGQQEISEYKI